MHLSFNRLVEVPFENLPPVVQRGAPAYPCWICIDGGGRTIIADILDCPARFWDPKNRAWRECSTDFVVVR